MNIQKILETIPKEERSLLQARIDSKLDKRLRARLKRDGYSIQEFFEAAVKSYLGDK